jgi:hypothetical protein
MKKRNLLIASALAGLLTMLIIAFEFAVADVLGGELTIVGICLSPFWLIICGASGALLYRRLAGDVTFKLGAAVGALGALLGSLVPFLGLILTFFITSDLQTAISGTTFFTYVGAVLIWIPLLWLVSGALGGLLAALIFKKKPAVPTLPTETDGDQTSPSEPAQPV